MKKILILSLAILFAGVGLVAAAENYPPPRHNAGTIGGRNHEAWGLGIFGKFEIPEITAPSGNPPTNYGWFYAKDNGGGLTQPYWEDNAGTVTNLLTGATPTAWDDITAPDNNKTIAFTGYEMILSGTTTTGDQFNFQGLGAFGDVAIVTIEQKTGNASDGKALQIKLADTDVDFLSLYQGAEVLKITSAGVITGGAIGVTYTDWQFSADGALTLACDDGGTMITLTPSAAAVGIDASNATITTALSVGANSIVGTTGIIDYTNFDVDAAGNVTAISLSAGTIKQDALVPASASPATITMNGGTTGGVTIGGISTGAITLGGGGGATAVTLPSTVDLTLSGGQLAITDTANANVVAITNNTMTTASAISISATATTSGKTLSITEGNAILTGDAIYVAVTDGAGFTGNYIRFYDGGADDFKVARYGATTIAGNASTDVLTITAGDVSIAAGKVVIATVDNEATSITRNQAVTSTPVLSLVETAAAADSPVLLIDQNATAAGSYGIKVDTAGGTAVYLNLEAAAGNGLVFATPASYTGSLISVNDTLIGANGIGIIDIKTTANMATGATLVRLDADTGTLAGATDGFILSVDDDTVAVATSYAVKIDSANNEALHVATGRALFDELATFTAGITSNGNTILGDAQTDLLTLGAAISGATPFILDGATDDTNELGIQVEDPTADRTIVIPNYSGAVPIVVAQNYTQVSCVSGTSDVAPTITLEDGWFTEGKTFRATAGGTVTGANAAISVILYFEDAAIMTLSTADGAAGDWTADFTIVAVSNTAQRVIGKLFAQAGADNKVDYAADTHDIAATGTIPMKLQIVSGNAGDTITCEYSTWEFWSKTD